MEYKQHKGKIVCTRDSTGTVAYDPSVAFDLCMDDSIPWQTTDKPICRLSDNSFDFSDTSRAFADLTQTKLAELGADFDEHVSGCFTTAQGYKMQFDTTDAIKMQGAIQLLEATGATEGYLTQADDTTIYNVPLDTMKAVLIEMMTAFAACHSRKQELRAAIKAAETVEDLDAIKITWPV